MKSPTFAPAYVALFPHLAEVAQANGYALCVHGSVGRDFDLVAAPWTDEAVDAETLFLAIAKQCNVSVAKAVDPALSGVTEHVDKPHGRKAWSILLGFGAVIDLSVMPRQAAQPVAVDTCDVYGCGEPAVVRVCKEHYEAKKEPSKAREAVEELECSWCGKLWTEHSRPHANYHLANIARAEAKRMGKR